MYTGYSGTEFTDLLVKMLGLAVNPSRLNNILDISELVRNTIIERNKDKAEEIIYNNIMIARMSHILFDDKIFDGQLYLQVLTKSFQIGQKAEKVLGLKWEDMWLEDLENLRNKLRIIC